MQAEARKLFGADLDAASSRIVDPCALGYLVGNGAQQGRRGYCTDELSDGRTGPRLVVVPAVQASGRFAITKQEVSWGDFGAFCTETGLCRAHGTDPWEPVTDIPIELAREFAAWLSERSGFVYRLPTLAEWRRAARGQPDPNRNCRVQLDGLQRGLGPVAANSGQANDFGLLNMLGNVQEWVVDGGAISAVGGAYSDPIQDCIAQTSRDHAGEPDPSTGFRLVREIS
jgi:non-specific serine/threonine protein kinase